jgi:hypothetical protein
MKLGILPFASWGTRNIPQEKDADQYDDPAEQVTPGGIIKSPAMVAGPPYLSGVVTCPLKAHSLVVADAVETAKRPVVTSAAADRAAATP